MDEVRVVRCERCSAAAVKGGSLLEYDLDLSSILSHQKLSQFLLAKVGGGAATFIEGCFLLVLNLLKNLRYVLNTKSRGNGPALVPLCLAVAVH